MQKIEKYLWGAIITTILIYVSLIGGCTYVTYHFITKYW